MDPAIGRFISEDPGAHGNNGYVYADDNPVNKVDANGKIAVFLAAIILGAVFALFTYIVQSAIEGQKMSLLGAFEYVGGGAIAGAIVAGLGVLIAGAAGMEALAGILGVGVGAMSMEELVVGCILMHAAGIYTGLAVGLFDRAVEAIGAAVGKHNAELAIALAECDG
jgi:hypothetical protein